MLLGDAEAPGKVPGSAQKLNNLMEGRHSRSSQWLLEFGRANPLADRG